MPVIHYSGWPIADDETAQRLLRDLSMTAHRVTGAPLAKISAFITEVPPHHWADGGEIGRPPPSPQTDGGSD